MNINGVHNKIVCIVSSLAIMLLIYGLFFIINNTTWNINFSLEKTLDFIESLSWKYIYFCLGATMLCLQCLLFKEKNKYYIIGMIITTLSIILFTILCFSSNSSLINRNALVYGFGLFISLIAMNTPAKLLEKSIGITVVMTIAIIMPMQLSQKMEVEINKIAEKYEKQFKELGYISVKSNALFLRNEYDTRYQFKRDYFLTQNLLMQPESENLKWSTSFDKSTEEYIKLYSQESMKEKNNAYRIANYEDKLYRNYINYFADIYLHVENNKLYIDSIKYDKTQITQQELAEKLDILMKNVIMPKLQKIKDHKDKEQRIEKSYDN